METLLPPVLGKERKLNKLRTPHLLHLSISSSLFHFITNPHANLPFWEKW